MSGYNGWANYETWAVKLWIDNDPGEAGRWEERAREIAEQERAGGFRSYTTAEDRAIYVLSENLRESHDEGASEADCSGLFRDLLTSALEAVRWRDIAKAILEDVLDGDFWTAEDDDDQEDEESDADEEEEA